MKYLLITFLSILCLITACEQQPQSAQNTSDTTRYAVVFRESLAGVYKKWNKGANSFGFYYTFTDRGRGPMFFEEITLNEQNFITGQSITELIT